MAIFPRLDYQAISQKLSDMPAVALLGPRQVGKTTLAREFVADNAIYLDLESPADRMRLSDAEQYLATRSDRLVIIDEVQRMTELFPLLRSLIDRDKRAGRFLLLGSASPALLARSSETLAGRIYYEELQPLVWPEVSERISILQLWLRGGFPDMLLAGSDESSFERRTAFVATYLERELPMLGLSASPILLRQMLQMIAHVQAGVLNMSALSRSLGVEVPTVHRYLHYLEESFILRRIQPWLPNLGKRLTKSPKLFIRDTGLLHAIAGIENIEELDGHPLKGASWESFVLQQIIACLKTTVKAYYYRTQDGTELDLVLVKGIRPVLGLEIKSSNAPKLSKGTTVASKDLGDIPVLVVTPGVVEDYSVGERVTVTSFARMWMHLRQWLR